MTDFSIVMPGKLVDAAAAVFFFVFFLLFVVALHLHAITLFIFLKSSRLYILILYVLLLEHSHEVVSTSVYFIRLVLAGCWPFQTFCRGERSPSSQVMQV